MQPSLGIILECSDVVLAVPQPAGIVVLSAELLWAHRFSIVCIMVEVTRAVLIKAEIALGSTTSVGLKIHSFSFPCKDVITRMIQMAVPSLWTGFLCAPQITSVKVMKQ